VTSGGPIFSTMISRLASILWCLWFIHSQSLNISVCNNITWLSETVESVIHKYEYISQGINAKQNMSYECITNSDLIINDCLLVQACKAAIYDHVPFDPDFLSSEPSRITIHECSGLICARHRKGPLSRIWWDRETILDLKSRLSYSQYNFTDFIT